MRYELNTIGKGRNTAFFFCLKSLRRRVNDLLEALLSTAPFRYPLVLIIHVVGKCLAGVGVAERFGHILAHQPGLASQSRIFPLRRLRRHPWLRCPVFAARAKAACKKQTAAPAPPRLFLPQAAARLRSPARVGGYKEWI